MSEKQQIELPNFNPSGKLVEETNTLNGVVLKYVSPKDKAKPRLNWRLHVFKENEQIEPIQINKKDHYLIGRERKVVDIPVDHPSCSGQHAVIQFREIVSQDEGEDVQKTIKPYIIDLESANGTLLNNKLIPISRFVELIPGDVIKFGYSTRDYVLLHDRMV